jgi:hypothetical protein
VHKIRDVGCGLPVEVDGKRYLSVDCNVALNMGTRKRLKKPKPATPAKKRLKVDKDIFDGVLEKLIQSKPVKRQM